MSKALRRALPAALVMIVALVGEGFAAGPCTCDDIPAIKARLEQRTRLAKAAAQVASEAAEMWLPYAWRIKARFLEIAFPNQTPTVEGVQNYGEKPQVSEKLKTENCDSIWKATQAHEDDHAAFDKTVSGNDYPWIMVFGQEGGVLAPKEARGYAVEVGYLTEELVRLQKECDKKQGTQASLERYQEQDRARRAEQKERLAHAATRVAAYAKGIK